MSSCYLEPPRTRAHMSALARAHPVAQSCSHMCSKSQWPPVMTMSQIMERWPWPKAQNWNNKPDLAISLAKNGLSLGSSDPTKDPSQCPCGTLKSGAPTVPTQTAVKLILWPSQEVGSGGSEGANMPTALTNPQIIKPPRKLNKKMWAKLPLRQIPSSLSAKMGWLGSGGGGSGNSEGAHGASAVKQTNAVFRSNSFR